MYSARIFNSRMPVEIPRVLAQDTRRTKSSSQRVRIRARWGDERPVVEATAACGGGGGGGGGGTRKDENGMGGGPKSQGTIQNRSAVHVANGGGGSKVSNPCSRNGVGLRFAGLPTPLMMGDDGGG
jgi:hypothetical protein